MPTANIKDKLNLLKHEITTLVNHSSEACMTSYHLVALMYDVLIECNLVDTSLMFIRSLGITRVQERATCTSDNTHL